MLTEAERLRALASAPLVSGNSTERTLAASLVAAADQLDREVSRNREAMKLIGKLSYDLSTVSNENKRMSTALYNLGIKKRVGT